MVNLIPLRQLGYPWGRHNFRVQATNIRRTVTVSGDIVHSADITMYRDGVTPFGPIRHVLRVDERKRELRYITVADPTAPTVSELTAPFHKEF